MGRVPDLRGLGVRAPRSGHRATGEVERTADSGQAMLVMMDPFWSWRAALGGKLVLPVRIEPEQGREKIESRVIFKQRQQIHRLLTSLCPRRTRAKWTGAKVIRDG